jgi:hypothetical protein
VAGRGPVAFGRGVAVTVRSVFWRERIGSDPAERAERVTFLRGSART